MPGYQWVEKDSGQEVMVIRKVEDRNVPPKGDEIPPSLRELDRELVWGRVIRSVRTTAAPGWNGGGFGKGLW